MQWRAATKQTRFESSEKGSINQGLHERFYRHIFSWFIYPLPFETSGTASRGSIWYIYIYIYSGAFLQHQKRHRKKGSGYKTPTFSALRKTHQLRDLLENTESSESSPSPLDLRRTDCAPTSSAVCGVVARASNVKLKGSKRFHNVAMNGEVLEPSRPWWLQYCTYMCCSGLMHWLLGGDCAKVQEYSPSPDACYKLQTMQVGHTLQ